MSLVTAALACECVLEWALSCKSEAGRDGGVAEGGREREGHGLGLIYRA